MLWDSVELRRECSDLYPNHIILCVFLFILCPGAWFLSPFRVCIRQFLISRYRFIINHTYVWLGKTLDIVASSIIYTYDVNKTQNSIPKITWCHTPASHSSRNGHDTMGNIAKKKICDDRLILHLWWQFFAHLLTGILTKHNIKETTSKGNIWGPFYILYGWKGQECLCLIYKYDWYVSPNHQNWKFVLLNVFVRFDVSWTSIYYNLIG